MALKEFGFSCGSFSVALTAEKFVVPGSKSAPFRKSLLPALPMAEATGHYTLEARHNGAAICLIPVDVLWVGHPKEPEPFIALRAENPEELQASLAVLTGKPLELRFVPRK